MLHQLFQFGQARRHAAVEFAKAKPGVRRIGVALHMARRKHLRRQFQHAAHHARFADDVDNVGVVHAVLRAHDHAVFLQIRLDEFGQPARIMRLRRQQHDVELALQR